MVDVNGQFWFTDYGYGMARLDNRRHLNRGSFEYGFVMLVLSIFGVNIRLVREQEPGYSYDGPWLYCTELEAVTSGHTWITAIVDQLRDQPASVFLDAEFYRQLGEQLPDLVAYPGLVIPVSEFLTSIARIRIAVRKRLAAKPTPEGSVTWGGHR
jgi:hypothetical protein